MQNSYHCICFLKSSLTISKNAHIVTINLFYKLFSVLKYIFCKIKQCYPIKQQQQHVHCSLICGSGEGRVYAALPPPHPTPYLVS